MYNKSKKDKLITITLHELHHAQGGGYACVPLMGDDGHYASTQDNYQVGHGRALGPTYIHEVEGCPELVDSVYLTPTSDQPYDPYQLRCKKNFGIYNHPKVDVGLFCVWYFVPGNTGGDPNKKEDEAKAEQEKQAQIDKKPGRFFEDQPDVNDDYQIHFNYLLAFDGKDREWDINGKMEEILLEMNEKMLKATARHKYSGGVAKKYKFDFRKDGKLDITFVRVDKRRKRLPKHPNGYFAPFLYDELKMQNPKKIYYNFADMNALDGGEAGVPMGSSFVKNRHNKSK